MAEEEQRDIGDFWMKILSLLLAIMVWFIIKTAAGLSYTNADTNRRPTRPEQPPPPLSNPDALKENNGTNSE